MRNAFKMMIFCLAMLLAGCGVTEESKLQVNGGEKKSEEANKSPEKTITDIVSYDASQQSFFRTYGFLSNDEILIAEQQNSKFVLASYHIFSGEKKIICTLDEPPIQVIIHPSKDYIYLHTSTNSSMASLTMLSTKGEVIHQFEVEASELALDWNSEDPELLALSAFQRDWTFQSYVYNGEMNQLIPIKPSNPFLIWSSSDQLLYTDWKDNSLTGGEVQAYEWNTGKVEAKEMGQVVQMEAYKDQLLTVQIDAEKEEFIYTLFDESKEVISWRSPALSNYSQWFVPQTEWLEDGSLIALNPLTGGLMDAYEGEFQLIKVKDGKLEILAPTLEYASFSCSPDGSLCLYGNTLNEVISFQPFEKKQWLITENET